MTLQLLGKKIAPHLNHSLGAPIFLVLLLGMMMVPLPPFMLDLMFTFNITTQHGMTQGCLKIMQR